MVCLERVSPVDLIEWMAPTASSSPRAYSGRGNGAVNLLGLDVKN